LRTELKQHDNHDLDAQRIPSQEHDPFIDEEPIQEVAASKEAIRSFWVCAAGLAVFAHLVIYFDLMLTRFIGYWFFHQFGIRWWEPPTNIMFVVFSQSFVPCLILATVVPILYWRGGLAQRFAIALAIVVSAMNSSIDTRGFDVYARSPLLSLLAIIGCWAMFPIVFLFTPIRTERLRLIVATCLLVLTVCVSFINMADLRKSHEFLYWQTLFGSAFVYALLRRNWGKSAMLESSATVEQIERTSSGTLLELMVVCGLASASYMYFSQFSYDRPISYYAQGSLLGIVSMLVFISSFRCFQTWKIRQVPWLILFWFALSASIHVNTIGNISNRRNVFATWMSYLDSPVALFAAAFSGVASFLLLCFLWCLGSWLRICDWRLADKTDHR
jgi:hypothetical protein